MPAAVSITEFTDPTCPWAYSAEPFRLRLHWIYGDAIDWLPRMVVLSERPDDLAQKGITQETLAQGKARLAERYGMPIDTAVEPQQASLPACRAVVAARLHDVLAARGLLRNLRIRNFVGEQIDLPATIDAAARDAGIADRLPEWLENPELDDAVADDMERARRPLPAARVLDEKLANWSGGRRYTCPSYEIRRVSDGVTISVPGFQPFAAYDVVLANLAPDLGRRSDDPPEPEEVLAWAGVPLATREVAELCGLSDREAREQLSRVATERPVGADGFWSPA